MQSLLILSHNKDQREADAQKICSDRQISQFDVTIVASEPHIGIDEIRNIQKKIFFKPLKSLQKAIIIHDAHTATIETQNALLKILEEPPVNTVIILTGADEYSFLPTILSRCTIIKRDDAEEIISNELLLQLQEEFTVVRMASTGVKLKKAQDIAKDKVHAISWLTQIIHAVRLDMFEKIDKSENAYDSVFLIQQLQKAYLLAKNTNVNLRFLLEDIFLSLS